MHFRCFAFYLYFTTYKKNITFSDSPIVFSVLLAWCLSSKLISDCLEKGQLPDYHADFLTSILLLSLAQKTYSDMRSQKKVNRTARQLSSEGEVSIGSLCVSFFKQWVESFLCKLNPWELTKVRTFRIIFCISAMCNTTDFGKVVKGQSNLYI